jgi:hypothetical protein
MIPGAEKKVAPYLKIVMLATPTPAFHSGTDFSSPLTYAYLLKRMFNND